MLKTVLSFFIVALAVCGVSCSVKKNNEDSVKNKVKNNDTIAWTDVIPIIETPVMISDTNEKRKYILKHYWDKFDFSDTLLVNKKYITESVFVNHLFIIMQGGAEEAVVKECVDNLCSRMEKYPHSRRVFMELNDDYLYNPNSQYYNEKIYLAYLERMIKSKFLGEEEKSKLIFRRDLITRNMPGKKATDFYCYLENDRKISLFNTRINGDYILLVFYAPECPSCMKTIEDMAEDVLLSEVVRNGKLTVFAVYTEGDEKEWRTSCGKLPDDWIKGNDRMMIMDKALYDLKAMPSLYLLDKEKKVLLKDATYTEIRKALSFL